MPRPLAIVLGLALAAGCGAPPSSSSPPRDAGPAAPSPAPPSGEAATTERPGADASRRAPDLQWDSSVGWERRIEFPPGTTSVRRREWVDYVDAQTLMWESPELAVQQLGALASTPWLSVILPHQRLCEPALRDGLASVAPSQLLLRIEGDPSPQEWSCLEGLAPPDLYLALCPDDGTTLWQCDGDAQLEALAARPGLRARVRALAVGLGEPRHWASLAAFPRLAMLTVRGPIVRTPPGLEAQRALCALPELAYVDLLDASQPGSNPRLPVECALGLETYEAWRLLDDDPEWGIPPTPVPGSVPCRLRRVMLWSADKATRELLSRCEGARVELVREDE